MRWVVGGAGGAGVEDVVVGVGSDMMSVYTTRLWLSVCRGLNHERLQR